MAPNPTPILRITHVDNLDTLVRCGGLHAPTCCPDDGLPYRMIHDTQVQEARRVVPIPCGPRGTIHDYVPFYFGPLSPMMLKLKTGQVAGYTEGQRPLIYLVSTAQAVAAAGCRFVFSNGHGLATFTEWFDELTRLDEVDWQAVALRYWKDTVDDMDRQRRKQAEFLVHGRCPWSLIGEIVVIDSEMQSRVLSTLAAFPESERRPVRVERDWYYW